MKRARHRLQTLAIKLVEGNEDVMLSVSSRKQLEKRKQFTAQSLSKVVFEQFLEGFRAGDPTAICRSYLLLVDKGIYVEKVSTTGGRIYFTFRDPDGHLSNLWGGWPSAQDEQANS